MDIVCGEKVVKTVKLSDSYDGLVGVLLVFNDMEKAKEWAGNDKDILTIEY